MPPLAEENPGLGHAMRPGHPTSGAALVGPAKLVRRTVKSLLVLRKQKGLEGPGRELARLRAPRSSGATTVSATAAWHLPARKPEASCRAAEGPAPSYGPGILGLVVLVPSSVPPPAQLSARQRARPPPSAPAGGTAGDVGGRQVKAATGRRPGVTLPACLARRPGLRLPACPAHCTALWER